MFRVLWVVVRLRRVRTTFRGLTVLVLRVFRVGLVLFRFPFLTKMVRVLSRVKVACRFVRRRLFRLARMLSIVVRTRIISLVKSGSLRIVIRTVLLLLTWSVVIRRLIRTRVLLTLIGFLLLLLACRSRLVRLRTLLLRNGTGLGNHNRVQQNSLST